MSIGHRLAEDELAQASIADLYSALGANDTPRLYEQRYTLDTDHDCPLGAGNSIDRKTIYIDRTLYTEVMDGAFKATDLEPEQIIDRWIDHEHTEIVVIDGDNAVATYGPAHARALTKEHQGVLAILGPNNAAAKIRRYEETIWPGLMRAYQRDLVKPPKDLWCGPLLDDATPRDEEILEILRKLGVADARKRSKFDVRYGIGANCCNRCRIWSPQLLSQERGTLAMCATVAGLVRHNWWCEMWTAK